MVGSAKSSKDKRRATRRKVLVRAEIAGGRLGKQWQPCILKDLSDTGCQIVGSNVELVNGAFLLQSEIHDRPQRFHVAWRSKRAIGARFLGPDTSSAEPSS